MNTVVNNSSSILSTYISTVDHLPCDIVRSLWLVQSCNIALEKEKEKLHKLYLQPKKERISEYVASQKRIRHLYNESVAEMDALCNQLVSHETTLKNEVAQLQAVAEKPALRDTSSADKLRLQLIEHYKQQPLASQVELLQERVIKDLGRVVIKRANGKATGIKIFLKLSKPSEAAELRVNKDLRRDRPTTTHKNKIALAKTSKQKRRPVALPQNVPKPVFRPALIEEEEEEEGVFCVCRQPSFGDMIACDYKQCPNGEWFHYKCVGLLNRVEALKYTTQKWYCSPACREAALVARPPVSNGKLKKKRRY